MDMHHTAVEDIIHVEGLEKKGAIRLCAPISRKRHINMNNPSAVETSLKTRTTDARDLIKTSIHPIPTGCHTLLMHGPNWSTIA